MTQPPLKPFLPPAPYTPLPPNSQEFLYGGDKFWTVLQKHGQRLEKSVFFIPGLDPAKEPRPAMMITAERLDTAAPIVVVRESSAAWLPPPKSNQVFITTKIEVPAGCWRITAHRHELVLSFVVLVSR